MAEASMYILPRSSVRIGEWIGRGGFSQVFGGVYTDSEGHMHNVAAKKVDRSYTIQQREIHIMKQLNHSNIIQFIGVFIGNQNDTYIIMELAEGGDLRRYLNNFREKNKQMKPVRLQPELVWHLVKQAASAIQYLHFMNHSHRDIKSSNYLIMKDLTLKLGDLGLAKAMENTVKTKGGGTCQWMAPEVIEKQHRSPKSDVFSFGIVVWEIVTTEVPYADTVKKTDFAVMQAVCGGKRPPLPEDCSKELAHLMNCCWTGDYTSRPDMNCVCQFLEASMPKMDSVKPELVATQGQGPFPDDVSMPSVSPFSSDSSMPTVSPIQSTEGSEQTTGKTEPDLASPEGSPDRSGQTAPVPQPVPTVETVLDEIFLMELAKKLGERWEQLAIYLSFSREDIFRFKSDNVNILNAIHAMLVQWRQKHDNQMDVKNVGKKLSYALSSCGRLDLAGYVDHCVAQKPQTFLS